MSLHIVVDSAIIDLILAPISIPLSHPHLHLRPAGVRLLYVSTVTLGVSRARRLIYVEEELGSLVHSAYIILGIHTTCQGRRNGVSLFQGQKAFFCMTI